EADLLVGKETLLTELLGEPVAAPAEPELASEGPEPEQGEDDHRDAHDDRDGLRGVDPGLHEGDRAATEQPDVEGEDDRHHGDADTRGHQASSRKCSRPTITPDALRAPARARRMPGA